MPMEQVPRQLLVNGGIRRTDVEFAEFDLGGRPCQIECALRRVRIVIPVSELERTFGRRRDEGRERHRCRLSGIEPHPGAEGDDRVEHRACRASEWTISVECFWVGGRSSAADEARAVCLARDGTDALCTCRDDVNEPEAAVK